MTTSSGAPDVSLPRVGVLGAGSIGGSAAARLASSGVEVATFDLDAERVAALVADGVAAAANARELAEGAEVIFLALPNTPHIEAALAGDDGLRAGLRAGTLVMLLSTIDPAEARRIGAELADAGAELLDTPVSGGPVAARAGELTIMAGGSDEAFSRAKPLLDLLSNHLVHVGPLGAGETAKLVNNLMGSVIVLGIAEGVALAAKAGLDVERTLEAIAGASGSSWILDTWIPRTILKDPSQTHFAVELMAKDMGLVRELAEANGVALEAGALAEKTFTELRDAGDGGRDFSILLARRAEAAGASLGEVD
ncbi:MAG TPA: NAD(P)-dependent oxidoreductase [Solirubrobacterales bacterium]|jgi:3-hydroxyisobutyrate dehydrogenase-like beta-hydroxyacid dehydrogenase